MESQVQRNRKKYIAGYILAGIAFVVGLALELLGYDAFIEGLIIAFGFFLATQNRYGTDRISDRFDRGFEKIDGKFEEVIKRLDRLIEK